MQRTPDDILSRNNDNIISKGFTLDVQMQPLEKITMNSGIDFYYDHVRSDRIMLDETRSVISKDRGTFADGSDAWNGSLFLIGNTALRSLRLNFGMRMTYHTVRVNDTIFGQVDLHTPGMVWNLGFNKPITPWFSWVGSINRGFRSPNISDLSTFGIADYRFEIPNTKLASERSISVENGFKILTGKLGATAFIYFTRLSNLVAIRNTSYRGADSVTFDGMNYLFYYTKVNAQKAFITGAELDLSSRIISQLEVNAMISYGYGQNITLNEPISRIPPLNGCLGVNYYLGKKFQTGIEWLFAGKQERLSSGDLKDIRIPAGGTLGWNCLNFNINARFNGWKINSGLSNLFNIKYRTHGSGVDAYGRNFWLEIVLSI